MSACNRRALVTAPKAPLEIEERPIPEAPPSGLVIKTHYAGICHSDVHLWEDEMAINETVKIPLSTGRGFPLLMGHEISGEVHSLGTESADGDLKVGDKVSVYAWTGCKDCGICHGGRQNICPKGSELNVGCSKVEGGYQAYVQVQCACDVIRIPDNLSMVTASLLACSGLTAYNAVSVVKPVVEEFNGYQGSSAVLVVGSGGLGHWAIQIAKAMLPDTCKVVAVDISEERVSLGKKAGADHTLVWPIEAPLPEIIQASRELCPMGFNAVLDFVNNPATIGRTVNVVAKGATLVQVGLFGGSASTVPLGMIPIMNISIVGVFTGNIQQQRDLLHLAASHKIQPPEIIKVNLEEAYEYLLRLRDGKVAGRAVIDFVDM